jgi:transcriptional regulator GlxA family with amidase domain
MGNYGILDGAGDGASARARLAQINHWEELAARAGYDAERLAALSEIAVSRKTLQRVFRERFGTSVGDMLLHWQLAAASEFIARTRAGNKHVAERFGFAGEAHLCHVFRRELGRTPQSFARSQDTLGQMNRPVA